VRRRLSLLGNVILFIGLSNCQICDLTRGFFRNYGRGKNNGGKGEESREREREQWYNPHMIPILPE